MSRKGSKLFQIFWVALAIKLIIAAILPITSDESYYWVWSYHPQLSYYDHPAMISLIYYLGHPFEFLGSAVRWPGVLISQVSLFIWIHLFRKHQLLSERQLVQWLILAVLHPLFGLGAMIITPDIPLLLFWPLALLLYLDFLKAPSWYRALAFGVCLGLGLLSKYMMVLLPLSIFAGLFFYPGQLLRLLKFVPIAVVGCGLGALPLLLWNFQNDWISFGFQLGHGITSKPWKPSWTYEYLLVQLFILFPPFVYTFFKSRRTASSWLIAVTVVPLVFFFITSFRGYVEVNWPIMVYPSFLAVVVCSTSSFWIRGAQIFWGITAAGIIFLVASNYSPFSKPIKTREFREFEDLYQVRNEPLFADSYQMASRLSFEQKRMIYKLHGLNRRDNFDLWEGSRPKGRFYLLIRRNHELPGQSILDQYVVHSVTEVSPKFELMELEAK